MYGIISVYSIDPGEVSMTLRDFHRLCAEFNGAHYRVNALASTAAAAASRESCALMRTNLLPKMEHRIEEKGMREGKKMTVKEPVPPLWQSTPFYRVWRNICTWYMWESVRFCSLALEMSK